ncbi:unnamed protein product [Aphanomyces euteiches]
MMTHIMKRFVESSASAAESLQGNDQPNDVASDLPRNSDRNRPPSAREPTPPSSSKAQPRRSVPKADLAVAIERFQYAMLLVERKSAVAQLQTLWNEADIPEESHRLIIPVILNALVSDPRDTELMESMLELMQAIVTVNPANATILLQEPHALDTILGLMQDPSPWIRGPTVQLIKRVQDGDSAGFATHILACQQGLRLLLEVVEDKREHIRDTAVQVLLNMTTNQTPMTQRHVQQFLAFEEGFARLFQIVDLELEGHGIESPVLADCLQVILNMIENNTMTQSLLRETPFISVLFPLLLGAGLPDPAAAEEAMPSTRPVGMKSTLDILACLVGPVYANVQGEALDEIAKRDQAKRNDELPLVQAFLAQQYEVVQMLGELACHGADADRIDALNVLHLMCQNNEANQLMLLTLTVSGPAYLLSKCLELDVHHEETPLGAASRTLLNCVWNSDLAKISILQHIHAPPPHENGPIEPLGHVLVSKLATTLESILTNETVALSLTPRDATKVVWKCCARWRSLMHNSECKLLALCVPGPNQTHATSGSYFLNTCLKWLVEISWTKPHYSLLLALFRLILSWIQGCPPAIHEVVTSVPTLTYFCKAMDRPKSIDDLEIEMAGLSAMLLGTCLEGLDGKTIQLKKEQLLNMITRQVGLQKFTDAFVNFQQLSNFRDLKRSPDGFVVYDKAFAQLYKHVAETTRVGIMNVYMGNDKDEDSRAKAYQDLIRMQDEQLHALQEQLKQKPGGGVNPLEGELQRANQFIAELKHIQETNEARIRGLTQSNDLVEKELQRKEAELKKLQSGALPQAAPVVVKAPVVDNSKHELRVEKLENEVLRLNRLLDEKDEELDASRQTIDLLTAHQNLISQAATDKHDQQTQSSFVDEALTAKVAALEQELEKAQATHTTTVSTLVARHEQQLKQVEHDFKLKVDEALQAQLKELQQKHDVEMSALRISQDKSQEEVKRLEAVFDQLQKETEKMHQMEAELAKLRTASMERESDDELLMLLGSMEIQCRSFREVLEQVLGKEGVDKALKLSQDRGAVSFLSSFFK